MTTPALHAAAFETRLVDQTELNWVDQTGRHSLGCGVARVGDRFIGFVNVVWDGLVQAFIADVIARSGPNGWCATCSQPVLRYEQATLPAGRSTRRIRA